MANNFILFSKFSLKLLTLKCPGGGQMDPPIGFSDQKFEAFKQSKWNFQHL